MKNIFLGGATLSTLLLSMSSTWAASAIELKVTGTFSTPSCNMTGADNGTIDLGKISVTNVQQTKETQLPQVTKAFSIQCDSTTFLSFKSIDNRAGTASTAGDRNFGLGSVNGTGKLGYYTVQLFAGKVDGGSTSFFTTTGSTLTSQTHTFLQPGARSGWSQSDNTQVSGKAFSGILVLTPYLASENSMNGPLNDQAKFDGSATLAFSYGL